MAMIRRRAAIGWVSGLVLILGAFTWASVKTPTIDGATGGAISRNGLLTIAALLPVLIAARAVSKFTVDNTFGAFLVPVIVSLGVALMVLLFGFSAEGAANCSLFREAGLTVAPSCYTSLGTRLAVLGEGLAVWLIFAGALVGAFKLRERSRRRKMAAA